MVTTMTATRFTDFIDATTPQFTNSPIHQFTNSPIHQFTNSPIHQFVRWGSPKGGALSHDQLAAVSWQLAAAGFGLWALGLLVV
jgi:hypothetical protein